MLKQITRTLSFILIAFAIFIWSGNLRDSVVEASQSDSKNVIVYIGNNKQSITTYASTVGALLTELGINLDSNDKISHPRGLSLKDKMHITVKIVDIKEEIVVETLPFETIHVASDLPAGKVIQAGENGEQKVTYSVTYVNGKENYKSKVNSLTIKQAIPAKISCGPKVQNKPIERKSTRKVTKTSSRGQSFIAKKVITMNATAYAAESFRHSRTKTGTRAVRGVVAVDPRVIPLGTKLYIEGYGYGVAADTGGAIKGNRIDLVLNTVKECLKFGRKKVKVHILK